VLAIIGDKDPLKAGVDEMQARMANLTVSVITGADHMTTFTNPKFVADLKTHLAAHSQSKAPVAVGAGAE
jgi:pimeloyl-ACP methyl ester carboxylesterase